MRLRPRALGSSGCLLGSLGHPHRDCPDRRDGASERGRSGARSGFRAPYRRRHELTHCPPPGSPAAPRPRARPPRSSTRTTAPSSARTSCRAPSRSRRPSPPRGPCARSSRPRPAALRADALLHVSNRITERADEIARAHHRGERQADHVGARRGQLAPRRPSASPRRRPVASSGEMQRLDTDAASGGRAAIIRRFPIGPVLGISPFNFPLNLVAHKVAPALAVGAPIVLKPAPATPLSALLLGELLAETDLPGRLLVGAAGRQRRRARARRRRAAARRVVHRLGDGRLRDPEGRAAQARHPRARRQRGRGRVPRLVDRRRPRLGRHAHRDVRQLPGRPVLRLGAARPRRLARSGTASCRWSSRRSRLSPTGSPWDEATVVGPLVDEAAAIRVQAWVDEAVAAGATLLTGGTRDGASYAPTVLTDVRRRREGRRARRSSGRCSCSSRSTASTPRSTIVNDEPLRAADRRVHPRPAGRVPRPRRARGRRRHRRRRADASAPTRCPTAA